MRSHTRAENVYLIKVRSYHDWKYDAVCCMQSRLCSLGQTCSLRPRTCRTSSVTDSHMSTSNQTTDRSTANFTAIFEAASNEYKTLTGQDLGTHPLATELESNN